MAASIWRGRITFGLVSIPVRLVKAARRERTRFRRVQRVAPSEAEPDFETEVDEAPAPPPPSRVLPFPAIGAVPRPAASEPEDTAAESVVRVRNTSVSPLNDAPVAPREILKGFEIARDEFVVLAPEEITALRPQTSSQLEITEFVKVEEIDPVYYETSYYVVPDPGGERAYSLLFATLKETGHAGMGSLAMHGREHVVLLRAGHDAIVLHSMFYANEVGRATYRVEGEAPHAKELALAKMLVTALEAPFAPEKWRDTYEDRLKALIESRTPVASAAASSSTPHQAPVADIMEALRKSLEMARKPVAREETPAAKPARAKAKRK